MVDAIIHELEIRKDYLGNDPVQSIYFGGGTPSLLNEDELKNILNSIFKTHAILPETEITLEANPDDLDREKLLGLKSAGVNRLSIGIQTFDNERLKFINRAHTSEEAIKCLELAKAVGFENLTADLIYAIPPDNLPYWENDLRTVLSFDLPHLSVYGLTIEEKTVFGNWARKGKLAEVNEDTAATQHRLAHTLLTTHGYEHYEVSNYAKKNMYSRHNTAYWKDQKYLGIGPGAHSYDGTSRGFNISSNARYLSSIRSGVLPMTMEKLSHTDRANEFIFTHLRTMWGVSLNEFQAVHHRDLLADHEQYVYNLLQKGLITLQKDVLTLTPEGFLFADEISWRLFYDQE